MTVGRAFPLLCIAVLAGVAGCQQAAPLSAADQAALRASTDSFVARTNRKDFAGTAALFAADGRMMPANEPAKVGRDAVQAWMTAYPTIVSFAAMVDEVGGAGDVAYVRGHYAIAVMLPGARQAVADTGKWVTVHRRQPDGSWLIISDIFNSDKPASH